MEKFETSFIPKQPLVGGFVEADIPHNKMGFLMFLSILLLVSMIVVTGGLYLYKNFMINKVASLEESMGIAKESFEPESISEMQLFDKRMNVSTQILSTHTVFSPVFTLLSELTIPSIQFTKFLIEPSSDGKNVSVRMSGLAQDYKSIALQSQVYNGPKGKYFKDVVFLNLVLQNDKINKGYVGFDVTFNVDPTLLSYTKSILTNTTSSQ